ncbi:MAG: hypothetical protein A3G81_09865 [Betaproteobacteria bacterium RIFCSPLOWO2_12_FULL_65_14]|nr:MAG: hypothetical protein A3G81_09865 [Betaproteobacteria bacterium RIFCSPLOWO2_12_FULL_65_14]
MKRAALIAGLAATFASAVAPAADLAIVLQDEVALRPAPRNGSRPNTVLWQGETVEVRGERLEYLQVYDYRRERGGYVRASQVRRVALQPGEAPELLAVLRFLRDRPGSEALGIGFAAAYIEAAPAEVLNGPAGTEALDALGTLAERLARRASAGASPKAAQAALSAHLDVAARHGVQFTSYERDGRMRICYDGMAFRRVLAMPSTPEQRARAALALTRPDCISGDLSPAERRRLDEWRAEVLDKVDEARLPGILKNRVLMRRAAVWSSLAYQRARQGEDSASAAERALNALAGVHKADLTEADLALYSEAAMRVSASRWAAVAPPKGVPEKGPYIVTVAEETGETCVLLADAKKGPSNPLAKRCTYGLVWTASETLNREGTALALAVQPTESWREMWIFHKAKAGWTIRVLPPASTTPNVGYAEFAGWVPGGRQMLVAREAIGGGKQTRTFELLRLDTLARVSHAAEPGTLAAFRRWQDPSWKGQTLGLR